MDNEKYYIELSLKEPSGICCFPCIDYEKTFSGFIFYLQKDENIIESEIYNFTNIKKIKIEKIEKGDPK